MVFVHAFAGAAIAHLAIRNRSLSDKQMSLVYALGVIGSILPDIDFLLIFLRLTETHRDLLTHSAVPYTIALIIWVIAVRKDNTLRLYGTVFYLAVLSHLGLDMLTGGLVLLAPLTYEFFGLPLPDFSTREEWARMYLTSPMYIGWETVILGVYLALLRRERNRVGRLFPWCVFLIAVLTIFLLLYL